jgi:hypothetical protein
MDWQQKALAMMALVGWYNFSIKLRSNQSWYIQHTGVERKEDARLSGGVQSGKTPEEAVNQCWEWMTDPAYYMVIGAGSENRKAKRWNGFMWEDVVEEK